MSQSRKKSPSPALVIAILALFVALGGSSYAAIRAASQGGRVFHGCVDKHTGALRVVQAGSRCRKGPSGEFAIAWNQKGTPGVAGVPGAAGHAGATGATGPSGNQGPAGTARAYGSVPASCAALTTCTLTAAQNASVAHPFTGIYCITVSGASPANTGAIATLENNDGNRIAYLSGGSCPSSTFEIQILNSGGSLNVDDAFFFAIP